MSDPHVGKFDRDNYDRSILMISDGHLMILGADEIVLPQPNTNSTLYFFSTT